MGDGVRWEEWVEWHTAVTLAACSMDAIKGLYGMSHPVAHQET